jgi:Flp pilus assembly protein TadD
VGSNLFNMLGVLGISGIVSSQGLGVSQTSLGDYQAAMWAYEQAINLDKNNPRTYELIGAMFKQRRQTTQANKVLRKALDLYQRGNDQEGVARIQTMLQEIGG